MKFRPEIEGLRALAVSLVLLSHLGFKVFEGGYVGVDVFFVISGFLITSLICNEFLQNVANLEYQKIFSLKNFYMRRVKRIIPLSFFVIISVAVFSKNSLNPEQGKAAITDAFWSTIFLQNVHLINNATNYFANNSSVSAFQHFWTLSVEEQFYFVIPTLLYLQLSKRGRYIFGRRIRWKGRILIFIIPVCLTSFLYSINLTKSSPSISYFSSLTRTWELGLGVILAVCVTGNRRHANRKIANFFSLFGLVLVLTSALFFDAQTPMPGYFALIPTLGACAIICGSTYSTNLAMKILSNRRVTFLGRISYSIYLWHWPIITLSISKYPNLIHSTILRIFLIASVLVISTFSFYLIEKPFRNMNFPSFSISKRNKRILQRVLSSISFISIFVLAIGVSLLHPSTGKYSPVPDFQTTDSITAFTDSTSTNSGLSKSDSRSQDTDFLSMWKLSLQQGLSQKLVPSGLNPPINNLINQSEYWRNCFAKTNSVACTYGNTNAPAEETAIVYGDSYAISILPSLLGSLDLSKWRVDVLTYGECMISEVTPVHNGKEVSGCNSFRLWARTYIREHPHSILFATDNPDVTILGPTGKMIYAPGTTMNGYWVRQFRASISQLAPSQKLFVFIGQTPQPSQSLGQCVSSDLEISTDCFGKIQSRLGPRTLEKSIFNSASNYYFDLQDVLCLGKLCPPIITGTPVLLDGSHLSYEMAVKLIPYFKMQLERSIVFKSLK